MMVSNVVRSVCGVVSVFRVEKGFVLRALVNGFFFGGLGGWVRTWGGQMMAV